MQRIESTESSEFIDRQQSLETPPAYFNFIFILFNLFIYQESYQELYQELPYKIYLITYFVDVRRTDFYFYKFDIYINSNRFRI